MSELIRGRLGWLCRARAIATTIVLGMTTAAAAQPPAATEPQTIERALRKHAPEIISDIRKHGYKNVGVLKFRVKKGGGQASDRVGLINQSLADRLEIALILADKPRTPLGIIHDASVSRPSSAGANHLEPEGRRVLLSGKYPLAWGKSQVTADAFLTGEIQLSNDIATMTVTVLAFDAAENDLRQVTQFTASTDPPSLFELGESLTTRGGFDNYKNTARPVKSEAQKVAMDPAAPVSLEVYFDGAARPLEYRGEQPTIPEPKEGQKLEFALSTTRKEAGRFGCVLKINGENTLFHEQAPSPVCSKWVLGPGASRIRIRGFQTQDRAQAEAFHVLSSEDSRPQAMHYGKETGLITLEVFPERTAGGQPDLPPPIGAEAEDTAAISRAYFPDKQPANRDALLVQIRNPPNSTSSRGLIVAGERIKAAVREADVQFDSTPVMFATFRYYQPSSISGRDSKQ